MSLPPLKTMEMDPIELHGRAYLGQVLLDAGRYDEAVKGDAAEQNYLINYVST
jgi:hypothetical protein